LVPYQNVHATLIQQSNQVVLTSDADTVKFLLGEANITPPDGSKLQSNWQANQQIALSRGVNDTGLFELNFNDERYLPFEGTGAVSSWTLRMPKAGNPIDFDSISDVIITLRYTALDGGDAFRQQLLNKQTGPSALQTLSGYRLFSIRQLNASGWQVWKNSSTPGSLELTIDPGFFPLNLGDDIKLDQTPATLYPWPEPNGDTLQFTLTPPSQGGTTLLGKWTIELPNQEADAKTALQAIDDILLIVPFQGTLNWDGWLTGA
jgi:hypothetical protein